MSIYTHLKLTARMAKNSSRSVLLGEDHQELAETVGSYLEASNYIVDYEAMALPPCTLA